MQSNSDPRIIEPVELRVEGVSKSFGAFRALHDVTLTAAGKALNILPAPKWIHSGLILVCCFIFSLSNSGKL